jgi:Fe-S-cluster-containing hydrogenase component 2
MLRPEVDWILCQVCPSCEARKVCNTRAIVRIDLDDPPYVAYDRCNGCGACITACCCNAISLKNNGSLSSPRV